MRSAVPERQRYQSQTGDKRDNQRTAQDESAKPTWEVMETTSSSPSFHGCDAEPNTSFESLDTPDGAKRMQDKLRWPHRAVSKEWQAMSWKWLQPDTGAFRVKQLCRLGRQLLTRWRSLCQPGLALHIILETGTIGTRTPWTPRVKTSSGSSVMCTKWMSNQRVLSEHEPGRRKSVRSKQLPDERSFPLQWASGKEAVAGPTPPATCGLSRYSAGNGASIVGRCGWSRAGVAVPGQFQAALRPLWSSRFSSVLRTTTLENGRPQKQKLKCL